MDRAAESTGWLDDQPDVVEQPQLEQGPSGTGTSTVAERARNLDASSESVGAKNFAWDLGNLNIGGVGQQAALKQSERERIEDSERTRKVKAPVGTERAAGTGTEGAVRT